MSEHTTTRFPSACGQGVHLTAVIPGIAGSGQQGGVELGVFRNQLFGWTGRSIDRPEAGRSGRNLGITADANGLASSPSRG